MQRKTKDGVQWLEFDIFFNCPKLKHAVFLRHGGYSLQPFSSLNLSEFVGDNFLHVQQNYEKVKQLMQLDSLFWMRHTHGTDIHEVKNAPTSLLQGDVSITKVPNIGLMTTHADCQAAIIYDPVQHVVANVHAGWKGSVQNIYAKVISRMKQQHNCDPSNILVAISPSLGPNDAEFINYRTELPEPFWDYQIKTNFFDFWAISKMQLTRCGILPHHIEIAEMSTFSSLEDCFSHRQHKPTGRHGTVVALL